MPLNKPSGNMYPWAYTWNPVAGECPHGCIYCYVPGKVAPWLERMGNDKYYGEPRLVESELKVRLVVPNGYVIFVQSCGDLFAYGVDDLIIGRVLNRIREFPNTTFLLQTKNPERFFDFNIPQNCILGTTLESNRNHMLSKAPTPAERYHVFRILNATRDIAGNKIYRLMLSLEPILDFDLPFFAEWIRCVEPEFVSVGADSGNSHLPEPSSEKLKKLLSQLNLITEVRRKKNLNRLLA